MEIRAMEIAVLVPCFNEEGPIGDVVAAFRAALPSATIHVYDNNSTDRTAEVARAAGAAVRREPLQGKGNVVRRMFSDIDADIYVLVDGDNTYEAAAAPRMIDRLLGDSLDLVNGRRVASAGAAYRPGHLFGNRLLTGIVALIFGAGMRDMLSGYKVMSRRFVKSFPALSGGFEIETELTVHALELRMPIAEIDTVYDARPAGSASKLNTIGDGLRIMRMIFVLMKEERPLLVFGIAAAALAAAAAGMGYSLTAEFLETGLVPRLPTAILATALTIVAVLTFFAGLILESVTHGRREMKRLHYLGYAPPPRQDAAPRP
jgi:glycosyltransferase involved in cell wall biosynthesis